jgi:hypothetical protein
MVILPHKRVGLQRLPDSKGASLSSEHSMHLTHISLDRRYANANNILITKILSACKCLFIGGWMPFGLQHHACSA